MLRSCVKASKTAWLVRPFASLPAQVKASEEVVDILESKHGAEVDLFQDGERVKPQQTTASSAIQVEFATPNMLQQAESKPLPSMMGQFEELREQFRKADERFSRAEKKNDQEQKQLRQSVEVLQENVEMLQEKVEGLEINLQYTRTIAVSVILRECSSILESLCGPFSIPVKSTP